MIVLVSPTLRTSGPGRYLTELVANEHLSRYGTEGLEEVLIADAPSPELALDHRIAIERPFCQDHGGLRCDAGALDGGHRLAFNSSSMPCRCAAAASMSGWSYWPARDSAARTPQRWTFSKSPYGNS